MPVKIKSILQTSIKVNSVESFGMRCGLLAFFLLFFHMGGCIQEGEAKWENLQARKVFGIWCDISYYILLNSMIGNEEKLCSAVIVSYRYPKR